MKANRAIVLPHVGKITCAAIVFGLVYTVVRVQALGFVWNFDETADDLVLWFQFLFSDRQRLLIE